MDAPLLPGINDTGMKLNWMLVVILLIVATIFMMLPQMGWLNWHQDQDICDLMQKNWTKSGINPPVSTYVVRNQGNFRGCLMAFPGGDTQFVPLGNYK